MNLVHCLVVSLASLLFIIYLVRTFLNRKLDNKTKLVIAFLHPACNSAGGGEKVLWSMIQSLFKLIDQNDLQNKVQVLVYSGEQHVNIYQIIQNNKNKFDLQYLEEIKERLQIKFIVDKNMLYPYPYLTILIQIINQIYFAVRSVVQYPAHVIIDSQGFPFTYIWLKMLTKSKVVCYTHYPYISSIMKQEVLDGNQSFKNRYNNKIVLGLKYVYYQCLYIGYKIQQYFIDLVLVNSSWTKNNMFEIWDTQNIEILYPPCNTDELLNRSVKTNKLMISLAQFRPEKNHQLQLEVFKALKDKQDQFVQGLQFLIIGSCRNDDDRGILDSLKQKAVELGIYDQIQFKVNVSFKELKTIMGQALIGIHTMKDEHFGISVVEMMAAGMVTVAHDSAGPRLDIIEHGSQAGFLASDKHQYVQTLYLILRNFHNNPAFNQQTIQNAQNKINRFSQSNFESKFKQYMLQLLRKHQLLKI